MRDKLYLVFTLFGFLFFFSFPLVSRHSDLVAPLVDSPAKSIGSDFNGDGISDILAGADLNDDIANAAGAVYLLYGSGSFSLSYALNGAGVNVTILGKAATNYLGVGATSAGDLNSDGFFDIVMGAPGNDDGATDGGAAYILYGHPSLSSDYRLDGGGVDATILGKAASDNLGGRNGTNGAGDVNGDGFDDLVVGAPLNNDGPGANHAGAAYILYGGGPAFSGTINIAATADTDVTVLGKAASDALGDAVSSAGDVNSDGFDDVIIGAYGNGDNGASSGGALYVLFGGSSLSATIRTDGAGADVTLLGGSAISSFGRALSGLGDVNGDG
ncbi:MAG: integrin alpha, partial [Deltaproteobacteria bacterium]